jgi:hypothetical protein
MLFERSTMTLLRYGLLSLALVSCTLGIGQDACVQTTASDSSFPLFASGAIAPILFSSDDWPGVIRVAGDLQGDLSNVTGSRPALVSVNPSGNPTIPAGAKTAVIIGSLNKSGLIQKLVTSLKVDVSSVQGKWETYKTFIVPNPFPGLDVGYLIIGSDKRGTIYGVYELSEQSGQSPWWWWADVPPKKQTALHAIPCGFGPPTIKYRGICESHYFSEYSERSHYCSPERRAACSSRMGNREVWRIKSFQVWILCECL